ncbi:MAG: PA0069 family radical SAM protein [Deltaproteobacteria bacterium]|nr:PA0069 family radical SAM protein [Deltaproteobacteria bacterium]
MPNEPIHHREIPEGFEPDDIPAPLRAIRGRGAVQNPTGRYEAASRAGDDPDELAGRRTVIRPLAVRDAMSRNDSPDVPFDRAVNPYRGCEHGCIYCFARPDHAYLGLSPGLDFEQVVFAKHDVAAALRRQWARPSYVPATLALGASTDPYQPAESELRLTRSVLALALECGHPVGIVTKSNRVLADLDLLQALAERGLVRVFLSVTTLDAGLQRRLEPRAAAPHARIGAIATLAEAGVPVGVLAAPMIPAVNDAELEAILTAAHEAGASSAGWILLRLPREVGPLFDGWLQAWLPERRERVLSLLRSARGGELYDSRFGVRMRGEGPYAALLAQRFELTRRRLGLPSEVPPLTTALFQHPRPVASARPAVRQLELF